MSDQPSSEPTPAAEFAPFEHFVRAYSEILDLLHASVVEHGRPDPWGRYDEHLDALHQHSRAVAALLVRRGRYGPEGALRIVRALINGCARAKREVEAHPLIHQKAERARAHGGAVELGEPLRLFMELVRQDAREWQAAAPPAPGAGPVSPSAPPPPPSDGEERDGRVYAQGVALRLTPQLRRLLAYLLTHNGASVETVRDHMAYTDRPHLEKRLCDLRNKIRLEGRKSGLNIHISTDDGQVAVSATRQHSATTN
jgi:hypothetical protein